MWCACFASATTLVWIYILNNTCKYRFDVQSFVEQPFLHIIGRSKASVGDQLKYVEERAKELRTLQTPVEFQNLLYWDILRYFSGE